MIFDILQYAGLEPSIISGAGLTSIIREGKIGNAKVGKGEWLVIEADESDGSIVQYHPEIGLLLNIDKDHQEIDELMQIFGTFRDNTKAIFITNRSNKLAAKISVNAANDFAVTDGIDAGFKATNFVQNGFEINFEIDGTPVKMNTVGRHNMENALSAIAVASQLGVSNQTSAAALAKYEGIYRRHQLIGEKNGIILIDDYAHNPAKCAASISACQPVAPKVIAWFQPHGYGPTRFLRADFVSDIAAALRPQDEIWMSEIFYAGGTAVKDISANDLIEDIRKLGKNAYFVEDRNQFVDAVKSHFTGNDVLLLMGARDPGLEKFAGEVFEKL
jgi:UDP-N-acetylmuramate--alanine ligase